MKFRGPIFFSALLALVLVAAYYPKADTAEKEKVLMQTVLMGLNRYHFKPLEIDDNFSNKVFELYLDRVDGAKRYLTQKDVEILKVHQAKLDDQALSGTFEFFDQSLGILDAAYDKTKGYYEELLSKPFNFNKKEEVELDPDKRTHPKNDAELKEYWRKYLKYQTLLRYAGKLKDQEKLKDDAERKDNETLEKESREELKQIFSDIYNRWEKFKRIDKLSFYLNAVTDVYDPHSTYFQPKDKEEFDLNFSGRYEGIGARLQNKGDYVRVSEVIVGGPAWRDKELEADDLIMKVTQENGDVTEVVGMLVDDVVKFIKGPKDTKVVLTVKRVDGTVKDIEITRDIIILEETYAKSLIMNGTEEGEKIGYVYLPGFYADFNDPSGRFCSQDIAVEIEKLKAQNVDGIILDLRNNGGGSLDEVVKMTGLFIEEGPIVQVKSRGRAPTVRKDEDPSVAYNGPLAVMVNNNSASASEILTAALQDYDRAIIVGSNSTFGKGTVQVPLDLDRAIRGQSEIKPLGHIMLTIQKYYRVNGGSVQLKGVVPDVVLPDSYHYIESGEKRQEYPLEWTEIPAVDYSQSVASIDNLGQIIENSKSRISGNTSFQKVLKNAKRLKIQRDFTKYPLNLDSYQDYVAKTEAEASKYRDIMKDAINKGVQNIKADLDAINADEAKESEKRRMGKSN